jgi:drug/metabolite transporter (DMT)-like permease
VLPSLFTTVFFSLSVIFGARSAKILGGPAANSGRIVVAFCFLAVWAHVFGAGWKGASFPWFLASGVIGFGLGDICLFGALPRIGPRLSILLTQCLAAPLAAAVEWAWLGTRLHGAEIACAAVILVGVALALAPDHGWEGERRVFWIGTLFGLGSAMGQGLGAVLSRKAYVVAAVNGFSIDGWSAAYQRVIGGAAIILVATYLGRSKRAATAPPPEPGRWRRSAPFVLGNALSGPVIGVGCFQWALQTEASGIVLPIVATSPLVTMLLSFFIDGIRPSRRAVFGSLLAVAGAVMLKRVEA